MTSATVEVEPKRESEQTSRLSELLACEEELAALMNGARKEAQRRVEAARDEAERAAAGLDAVLAEEAERARGDIDDAARARVRALMEDARAQVARFDGVPEEEVARLAESALRRLMGHDVRPR